MNESVYIETTIPSYLSARSSRDLIVAAHQRITHEWWEGQREKYQLFISPIVVTECSAGDPERAKARLALLTEMTLLEYSPRIDSLTEQIMGGLRIPQSKRLDAMHLAYAVEYQIDFVMTWNCSHLANAQSEKALASFCKQKNVWMPILCTPEEVTMEEESP